MDEFALLGGLHEIIDQNIDIRIKEWLDNHNVNYYLLYPLAMVELGAMSEVPESTNNLFKRCITSYVYSKVILNKKKLYLRKLNIPGLKKYMKEYEKTLYPLFQNYRFSREINDINPVSKARLTKMGEHRYQLTTSLVTDKYKEEDFYFYGEDDKDKNRMELEQTKELHLKFWHKIVIQQTLIKELEQNIDKTLFRDCLNIIEKDLNKWNSKVRSKVFDNPRQIALVIAFFYYYAMIRSICVRIVTLENEDYIENADECIMQFDKEKCIHDIVSICNIREKKVRDIVEYFINKGNVNLLEFPLFEIENKLITVPSLILVNDWQFTVVNGHYTKNISILNRQKTISVITEGRLEKLMESVRNVAIAKTVPYNFKDVDGKLNDCDVDFAIWDKKRNAVLVIEAKWIDKHYGDEIDKRYGKIFETLNSIYTKQISKHKIYLSEISHLNFLFKDDVRFTPCDAMPEVFYLAVDKRNQMHIGDKHLISEFMLIYFLKKHIYAEEFDLLEFWSEISSLQTKFEYIQCSTEFHEIPVGEDVILVEKGDLTWGEF